MNPAKTSGGARPRFACRKLQWARRSVQSAVLAFIALVPVLGHYGNTLASRELDALLVRWRGRPQGEALRATDTLLRALPRGERERAGRLVRDDERALERVQYVQGNTWSARIGSLSLTDPLAGAESFAASRRIVNVLIVSLLVPIAVTLLLGRVYCSWICPMNLLLEITGKLRRLLRFLEIPVFNVRFPRASKYVLLVAGLFLAWLWAMPILGSLYPPAVIGRELGAGISEQFERAERGLEGLSWAGFGLGTLFILGIALFEILVSERWWCRTLCPGGALYALLGRFRPVRVGRDAKRCTSCGVCVQVCGMGLQPLRDRMGMECDSCGLCISHCSSGALGYRLAAPPLPVLVRRRSGPRAPHAESAAKLLILAAALLVPRAVAAHHILGIPHYAYDESYPQAPVITYRTEAGEYEVRMTGYPGHPVPGERTTLHVYITHRSGGDPFAGPVTLCALRDGLAGEGEVIYGPVAAAPSQGLYKFYPTFDREDNFLVRIEYTAAGAPWKIDLPVVVGEPGSPLVTLGGFAAGLVALLVVVRAVRIKRERWRRARAVAAAGGEG